ncbi:hypothetical protein XA68_13916 [Ophiocordyceps unilateralis]|uniref:Glycosyl transferase n=1 Tax=Ophiocordyceps unilateralis TaxID=268505 RepID=A0A2A9PBP2_OPHUN|nr:hypothetical protein XA68_13916 [Ophiocordyceps unilateralis]
MMHRSSSVTLIIAALFVILLTWPYHRLSWEAIRTRAVSLRPNKGIPNTVHFIFLLKEPDDDFPFAFSHYLSVYSAWYYLQPSTIYLHTDAGHGQIHRARQGLAGKWAQLIMEMPGLIINRVKAPAQTNHGVEIVEMAHKSDFIRVHVLHKLGGVYMDFDVFFIHDARPLLTTGFESVSGREPAGLMTAGIFFSRKRSTLLNLWMERMHQVFDGGWTTHSNGLMTRIGEQLIQQNRKLLVLDESAFTPVTWESQGIKELLEVHDDVPSMLEHHSPGDKLALLNHYDEPLPSWAINFNKSYSIHAFHIEEEGGNPVTPRKVLQRQSNIGRALYPIVRNMYHRGLVSLDDE